jgi:hypothetical protein
MTRAQRARLTNPGSRRRPAVSKPRSRSAVMPGRRGGQRRVLAGLMAVAAAGGLAIVAQPALAAALCVGGSPGCYPTIQAAVNAAHDGDTITIGPGTFAGGVTITKSVHLLGAGSAATIIRGGGSVLTIGAFGASSEPTVSISGVTITGGVARSSPESIPFTGKAGVWAAGGGIEIPPGAHLAVGATVTLIGDSVADNSGSATGPSGEAQGGGIWNGTTFTGPPVELALQHTAVTSNSLTGSHGVKLQGGGLFTAPSATVILTDSVIALNNPDQCVGC